MSTGEPVSLLGLEREAAGSVAHALEPEAVLDGIVAHALRIRPEASARAAVLEVVGPEVRVLAGRRPDGRAEGARGRAVALSAADRDLPWTKAAWTWRVEDLGAPAAAAAAESGVVHGAAAAIPGQDLLHLVLATGDARPFAADELCMLESLAGLAAAALENAGVFKRLAFLATTDELTGLPNRRSLDALLSLPQERALAILAIDVDNLKRINDERGHDAGDRALKAIAEALKSCLREGDLVARIGGDEFVAVLFGAGVDDATDVADRMRETVRAGAATRVSIGIAYADGKGEIVSARQAADKALYAAKSHGRDSTVSHEGQRNSHRRLVGEWAATLDTVIAGPGMFAVYQPIVCLRDCTVAGYSARVRPAHGAVGMSVAGMFDAAGKLGVLRVLDWEARRTVLAGAATMPSGVPLFIKSAPVTILDPRRGPAAMVDLTAAAGRSPSDIVIEVPAVFREPAPYLRALEGYRRAGFGIAVSGFGNGSRLQLDGLAHIAPDYVKVSVGALSPTSRKALDALTALAAALPATLVADQMETQADIALAAAAGIEHVQGFAVARLSRRPQRDLERDLKRDLLRLLQPLSSGICAGDDGPGSGRS